MERFQSTMGNRPKITSLALIHVDSFLNGPKITYPNVLKNQSENGTSDDQSGTFGCMKRGKIQVIYRFKVEIKMNFQV